MFVWCLTATYVLLFVAAIVESVYKWKHGLLEENPPDQGIVSELSSDESESRKALYREETQDSMTSCEAVEGSAV